MAGTDFDKAGHAAVSVAIICMIADTELRAIHRTIIAMGGEQINQFKSYPSEQYYSYPNKNGVRLTIVVACCKGQTNLEAALTTGVVLFRHYPRYAFLCGIAGGLSVDKVKLGDVVIGSDVVYRRYTKIGAGGHFLPELVNVPASQGGADLANSFFVEHPHPKRIQSSTNDGEFFAAHAEKILSWDYVLDHEPTGKALLSDLDRKLVAVEMEGAGFLKAIATFEENVLARPWERDRPPGKVDAVVVRGISDAAADKAASDANPRSYRDVAARNAAHAVLLLLDHLTEAHFSA